MNVRLDETWLSAFVAAIIVGAGACAIFADSSAPAPYTCRDCAGDCFRGVCEPTFGITKDPGGEQRDGGVCE